MAETSKAFTQLLADVVERLAGQGKLPQHWATLEPKSLARYAGALQAHLLAIEQGTLQLLAQRYLERQATVPALSRHLSWLAELRQARLGDDLLGGQGRRYERQLRILTHYQQAWRQALEAPGGGTPGTARQRLEAQRVVLERQVKAGRARAHVDADYLEAFTRHAAIGEVLKRFDVLFAPSASAELRAAPGNFTQLPLALALLALEERPGHVRVTLTPASAGSAHRLELHQRAEQLVVAGSGRFYLAFGDSGEAVMRQQLQLRYRQPGYALPLFTPLRSLLLGSDILGLALGALPGSATVLANGLELKLREGRGKPRVEAVHASGSGGLLQLTVSGALGKLLGRFYLPGSLETVASAGDGGQGRGGKHFDPASWVAGQGPANPLYLLPLKGADASQPVSPFDVLAAGVSSRLRTALSDGQLKQLYEQHMTFFVQLAQGFKGDGQAPAWLADPARRKAFETHLGELLALNHLAPAALLHEGAGSPDGRDIHGNSAAWVAWERSAGQAIWRHPEADRLVRALAEKLPAYIIDMLAGNETSGPLLASARRLLAPLYGHWLVQADWEANRQGATVRRSQGQQRDVEAATPSSADHKLLQLLARGGVAASAADAPYKAFVDGILATASGRALRKQLLFQALALLARDGTSAAPPSHPHPLLEGHDQLKMSRDNVLLLQDPYLAFNPGAWALDRQGTYRVAVPDAPATRYMRTLGLPQVGGVSGLAAQVTQQLSGLLQRPLTLQEYWLFQLNQAAFNLLRGEHALFEVLYVAARHEPHIAQGIGKRLLALLDRQHGVKARDARLATLYTQALALVLPIVNQGVAPVVRLELAALPAPRGASQPAKAVAPAQLGGATDALGEEVSRRYQLSEKLFVSQQDPRFLAGKRGSGDIAIPGWYEGMTTLDMKRLFLHGLEPPPGELEGRLSREQQGALAQRIGEQSQHELITKALAQSAKMAETIRQLGSVFDRLAPQDFYLTLVGDASGGRCYPLVRAMAVALQMRQIEGGNRLVDRLFTASASPLGEDTRLLREGLRVLHTSVDASSASASQGQLKLSEVAARLGQLNEPGMFALNTPVHAMLVGMTQGPQGRHYYFYDPNFALFAFKDAATLAKAMKQHLVQRQMALFYQALGSPGDPGFDLVKLDTGRMATVLLGNELQVGDLVAPFDLYQVREKRRQISEVGIALEIIEARNWATRFRQAAGDLAQRSGLDNRFVPAMPTVKEERPGVFAITYVNREQLNDLRQVVTRDPTFIEFRRFVNKQTQALYQRVLDKARTPGFHASMVGLNAVYALQTLLQGLGNDYAKTQGAGAQLSVALSIQGYLGLMQVVNNTAQDASYISDLVRQVRNGDLIGAGGSLTEYVARLARATSDGVGLLLGGLMVGLDGYELIHASNERQRALFATRLAFDSASMITSVAGIGAEMLSASMAGAVLGAGSVLLSGLAVGFGGLAEVFGKVYDDAQAVGRYFDMIDRAYRQGGYHYNPQHKALIAQAGAVITHLDLRIGMLQFDSQHIYRSNSARDGASGSGAANYFFWAGHMPHRLRDRQQAIDIREGLGYPSQAPLPAGDARLIVLPATPRAYLDYGFGVLPFATMRHAKGFDVIRRLERDKRFDYDFYIFPSERVIDRIDQEYVATTVEVLLDDKRHHLVVPRLNAQLQGYLHYAIKGAGGRYQVSLNRGVSLRLEEGGTHRSTWVLDISELDAGKISVAQDGLVIDGVKVDVAPGSSGPVMTIDRQRVVREVDFARQRTSLRSVDASQMAPLHGLEHTLEAMTHKQRTGSYVMVEHYPDGGGAKQRAFYDVANKRMILPDFAERPNSDVRLVGVAGNSAYFHDAGLGLAWRTSLASGKHDPHYARWMWQRRGAIKWVGMEHDTALFVEQVDAGEQGQGQLVYRAQGDRIELVAVIGDHARMQARLNAAASTGLAALFGSYGGLDRFTGGGDRREIVTRLAPVLVAYGVKGNKEVFRAWVHTHDGAVVRPLLEPPSTRKATAPATPWPVPSDLLLSARMVMSDGLPVYLFFSAKEKTLFRQVGNGWSGQGNAQPTAMRLASPPLASILNMQGKLYAISEEGLMSWVDHAGHFFTVAVTERWLEGKALWWKSLDSVPNRGGDPIAVYGVMAGDGKRLLPTWYHQQRLIVVSPTLATGSLQFLGVTTGGEGLLFEPDRGKVYVQPLLPEAALAQAFGASRTLKAPGLLPGGRELLPGWRFKSADLDGGYLQLTTVQGEIYLRSDGNFRLVGVDEAWQRAHAGALLPALTVLAAKHPTSEVMALEGAAPGWFDTRGSQLYRVQGRGPSSGLRFVGNAPQSSTAFVFDRQARQLLKLQGERCTVAASLGDVRRVGRLLLVQGDDRGVQNEVLAAPTLANVANVVLHGGSGSDTYRVDGEAWGQYNLVIIDNYDKAAAVDRLQLPGLRVADVAAWRVGSDLWLGLADRSKAVVLRGIHGDQAHAYRHLRVEFAQGAAIDVERLAGVSAQVERLEHVLAQAPAPSDQTRHGLLTAAMAMLDDPDGVVVTGPQAPPLKDGLLVNPGR
ncbi:TcdA/TcdB pore-forming domain-containing protein [Pseudomonas sp. MWU13-3659]|uniref:TcdA/TcdB pore-forming domain-containing protein n=1 Tax=Pseudomonas sp. MWU13-3659 TaxID=2986964 RepID=UPI002074F27C|nr:TcdA/TcdB pore-forming domain-containing protein [Pseudomonas sp. MWU13-3659]